MAELDIVTDDGYTAHVTLDFQYEVNVDPLNAPPGQTDLVLTSSGNLTVTNTTPGRNLPSEAFGAQPRVFLSIPAGPACEAVGAQPDGPYCFVNAGTFLYAIDYQNMATPIPSGDSVNLVLRPETFTDSAFEEGETSTWRVTEADAEAARAGLAAAIPGLSWERTAGPIAAQCGEYNFAPHFVWTANGAAPC